MIAIARKSITGYRGFTLVELMVVIVIIAILALAAVLLVGKNQKDAAHNSAAQQAVDLGTKSAKSAYYSNDQDLPTGGDLQSYFDDGEPGVTFTAYDVDHVSNGPLNITYTRDWGDQASVCAKSETGYYYCERTTYGQTRLQTDSDTRERGDSSIRSRCVGLSEPSTRACLADATHPAQENADATYGWNPSLIGGGGGGGPDPNPYLTAVMADSPSFYCSFDDPSAPLPTPMDCDGASSAEWSGSSGTITLEQTGAIISAPSSKAVVLNGSAQNSYAIPVMNALRTSTSAWTAEVWLRKDGGTGTATAVSVDNTINMRLAGATGLRFDWRRTNGVVRVQATNTAQIDPPSPWVYFVAVWDQPDMKLYVNGALAVTATLGATEYPAELAPQEMRVGYVNGGWTGGTTLTGGVDEFAFYPSALSAARIAAHYAAAGY